ncbi:flagellin N-terminal helical domain-containing protein [Candidatus Acetatifactor stercoripullorum]|uniref:flagellin N-terminal helical domain-containing protein n=1 Tax=Candidatus Acetatifactor stercoripullorum TaxID=2838414 RepID=UPI00298E9662|nr:flagellin [Candidatus Acetatifactor stercoripullorum]
MVVQHNLTAMNSNRMLGLTMSSQAKSTEKLSSGYKINRAADDAAGLSISEKMRRQIRGLTQASLNAQDGISAVQTAEGALTEVHDMLQRMDELAVKAANGTNSEDDRQYIQDEIDQLVTEIDRVATTTKFNESYLLKGVNADGEVAKLTYNTANAAIADIDAETGKATYTMGAATQETVTDKGTYDLATVEINGVTYGLVTNVEDEDAGQDKTLSIDEAITEAEKTATGGAFTTQEELFAKVKADLDAAGAGDIKNITTDSDGTITVEAFADLNEALEFSLHVGADSTDDNKIALSISMMSARGLGVNGLKVSGDTADSATAAIDTISAAIQKVSTQRSALGAVQNRLEHTINNLDNVVENTTSAESQIRDTDMATEMVKYSNNQILAQAGQAMLAQSNQANQGVLALLQ